MRNCRSCEHCHKALAPYVWTCDSKNNIITNKGYDIGYFIIKATFCKGYKEGK